MVSRDDFQVLYAQGPEALWQAFNTLQEQVHAISERQQELEARVSKDSHNSSKPPSSDGLGKKKKRVNLRTPSGRKPGGQPGNPGRNLAFLATTVAPVVHTPACCAGCGHSLQAVEVTGSERRQVHDLPPVRLEVTEHVSEQKCCPACGLSTRGVFPVHAPAAVQYGPRLKALGVYLLDYQLLPYKRLAALFAALFGVRVSAGMLCEAQQRAYARVDPVVGQIREALTKASVVHFDETGFRIAAGLHWLHSASTSTLTAYAWHKKRGKGGMDAGGILPSFGGTAVHDGYASYQHYACSHALCNAHHLRALTALAEQGTHAWAGDLRHLLCAMKNAVEAAQVRGDTRLPPAEEAAFVEGYRALLQTGLDAHPPPIRVAGKRGRLKQSPARNLLLRLQQQEAQVLAFLYDFRVPFDNNQAERDIRMMKLQQKIAGGFRSTAGADAFCGIRSYLCTLQKQGINLLSALEHVFRGDLLSPALA